MGFLDSWSRESKIIILVIMAFLVISILGVVVYHLNYKSVCVPNEKLTECKSTLNQTEFNLKTTEEKLNKTEAQKELITKNSTLCDEELRDCRKKFETLNESYTGLLFKFNALNESYEQLLLNLSKCKVAIEEKAKNDAGCVPYLKQEITKSYIIISLVFFLFLLLPFKIEFGLDSKEKKTKRSIMVFVIIFSIGMFLLEYIGLIGYWINFLIILIISSIFALITYFLHKE